MGYLFLIAYAATIFAANWAIETFGLVPVGFGLMAPAGVFFAGLALGLRDAVQETLGKRATFAAVLVGAGLSALVSPQFAIASGAAFLASELADFAVYTPLRARSWPLAVAASNAVGDAIDSALFLLIAFGSLDFLAGQLVGKWYMVIPALLIVRQLKHSATIAPRAEGA
jgi:queuosine precursor transporter